MPTLTLEYRDESERLALEQAIAYVSQLRQVAQEAPSGTVLDTCEKLALDQGRTLLRSTLANALQARIELAQKKGGKLDSASERTLDSPREPTNETS